MPYQNELADKTSHIDIVQNPDVSEFLSKCHKIDYQEECLQSIGDFFSTPIDNHFHKPENVISIDGSYYEASVRKNFPSKKVGFIKVGAVLLKHASLTAIQGASNFVDPFEVANFKKNNDAYTFVLPSTNIIYDDCEDVQASFRKALDERFDELRDVADNPNSSLRNTLFKMASYLDGCNDSQIRLSKCPCCGDENNVVINIDDMEPKCPHCGKRLFFTDILRVWEIVEDNVSNQGALSRTMNVIERLLAIHYIRTIVENQRDSFTTTLENLCFFIDGPLAIFGEPAKFHSCFMKYLDELNQTMRQQKKTDILMAQKTISTTLQKKR